MIRSYTIYEPIFSYSCPEETYSSICNCCFRSIISPIILSSQDLVQIDHFYDYEINHLYNISCIKIQFELRQCIR